MNVKDILNADIKVVWAWIKRGYSWWTGELWAMVPPEWRARFAQRPATVAQWHGGRFLLDTIGQGNLPPASGRDGSRARLLLPENFALMREFMVPAVSLSDIRRMVALDIDRLTPFKPEAVWFDVALLESQNEPQGRRRAVLGVLPRSFITDVLATAEGQGLEAVELKIAGPYEEALDFLPAIQKSHGSRARRNVYWWSAVGILMAANLLLLVMRDWNGLNILEQTVVSQQTFVTVAERIGAKVQSEASARETLVETRTHTSPLRILDAATKAIPHDAWVRRLEWNGKSVRLIGFKDAHLNIVSALESAPLFRNARAVTAQTPSAQSSEQPFDVSADMDVGPR